MYDVEREIVVELALVDTSVSKWNTGTGTAANPGWQCKMSGAASNEFSRSSPDWEVRISLFCLRSRGSIWHAIHAEFILSEKISTCAGCARR